MSVWAWPAIVFAAILLAPALARRRFGLAALIALFAAASAWLATLDGAAVRFAAPPVVLLAGYWLSGPFYTKPSPRLEAWLMRLDAAWRVDETMAAAPPWLKTLTDLTYISCYPFMAIAALPAFFASRDAFAWHWLLVLAAELACYVTLPWLQARPPRDLRREIGVRPRFLRRLNERALQQLSVRATTIPSGHVAGPIAASLSVWMIAPEWAPWLMAGALAITAATVMGRYHYAVDALLGLATGALPPAIIAFWP